MSRPWASRTSVYLGQIWQKMSRLLAGSGSRQFGVQIFGTEKMSRDSDSARAPKLTCSRSEVH